jgi:hypothetical protein
MNMRLPIFQLTWGENNGVFGLVFPSELKYETQFFTFVIPIPAGYLNERPRYDFVTRALRETEFYFPIEVAGEYQELRGEIIIDDDIFSYDSESNIRFTTPTGYTVELLIDLFQTRSFYRLKGMKTRSLNRYVGNFKKPVFDDCVFVPLVIKDITILNDFFLDQKGIFVGYTKDFGVFDGDDQTFQR